MKKKEWQCECGEILNFSRQICPTCGRSREKVIERRKKKFEIAKKHFLLPVEIIFFLGKEREKKETEIIEKFQKEFPLAEIKSVLARLLNLEYLKFDSSSSKYSLSPKGEVVIFELALAEKWIDTLI